MDLAGLIYIVYKMSRYGACWPRLLTWILPEKGIAPPSRACLAALAALSLTALFVRATPVAFPGAEGFGRFATGGRGGDVYIVTNLNNSGAGSLREAVTSRTAGVPRTVIFAVSGTIYLQSTLRITKGDLTIAGQTAPGDGICLAHYPLDPSNATNVIIRFIRSRLGDSSGLENDAFSCRYATNVIIDHCSFSWSVDETATAYDNTNFTMQWCIAAESLRDSVHSKGPHGYGGIWGGLGASFHHNLLAHHDSRNPRFNGARTHGTDGELVDLRNNVIYNWKGNSTYGGEPTDAGLPSHQNVFNNYYKNGPATGTGAIRYRVLEPSENTASTGATFGLFHVSGNYTAGSTTVSADNWAGGVQAVTAAEIAVLKAATPFTVAPVITQSAVEACPLVLAYAGCRLPARDSVDARIASEVASGTATYRGSKNNYPGIIDSQNDVGGWPTLASLPAPADTDADGMPDAWETAHGLNPNSAADRNLTDADGYTRLENYLNSLATAAFPLPQIGTPPSSQTVQAGAGFTLSVVATGPGPLSYQWYHGTSLLENAAGASYTVTGATLADAGDYTVAVSNAYGETRSAAVTITLVSQPPLITTEPVSLSAAVGQSASFAVVASGSPTLAYQWYRGTTAIPGATAATLAIDPVGTGDAGSYHVLVSNPYGTATSATVSLTVSDRVSTTVFSTNFSADTLHAASPTITATATNWYVMSSKNATSTAVGDDPATAGAVDPRLDLTMPLTGSGVVECAARFTTASNNPVSLAAANDTLRLRATVVTTNVRVLAFGLFNAGGSLPYVGMNNAQLVSSSSTFATGGTQGWLGYRAWLDASAPSATLEGRSAQPGTNNASQALLIPGTSSSAPTVVSVASAAATGVSYADGAIYTLTLTARRATDGALALDYTLHAGTDVAATPLATVSASVASASALTSAFDSVAIGYRNTNGTVVSHLKVTALSVTNETTAVVEPDAYQAFLATYGLDSAGNGADDADPDADGLSNAFEFVLGGNPLDPSSTPRLSLLLESATQCAFTFTRRLDADEIFDLAVQQSTDLTTWNALTAGVGGVTVTTSPLDAEHEQVTLHAPIATPQIFFRLRATRILP